MRECDRVVELEDCKTCNAFWAWFAGQQLANFRLGSGHVLLAPVLSLL